MNTWNELCRASIEREKREVEEKYGIKIGKTEIHCLVCGKKWDFGGNNGCPGKIAHTDMLQKTNKPSKAFKRTTGLSTDKNKGA